MIKLPKWEKKGLIFSRDGGNFFKTHTTRPIPYLIDNKLRLYFSSRSDEDIPYPTYIDVNPDRPEEILFICDQPMMDIGRTGAFDDSGITPVSVLNHSSDKTYMYYVGWKRRRYGVTIETSIGVAELAEGGTRLKRLFEGPIIGQDVLHPILVAAPFVVKTCGQYIMWYCSGTKWIKCQHGPEMIYTVYQAKSDDGITWRQVASKPLIPYSYDGEVISAPWVEKSGNNFYMWYSYRGSASVEEKNYCPGLAISVDGNKWVRCDSEVNIEKSESGWDSEMICYPAVFNYGDNTYMFYSGNGVGKGGIGYAVADKKLDINWW